MSSTETEPHAPPSGAFKRALVGRPMASGELEDTLLPKWMALPIFASDPISSVAYATEAAMVVLVGVSVAALKDVLPVSIAIAALLAIVGFSYTQTVRAYESSGGAYVVAKENLGTLPSLVAAAALLTDYVLTVAVSISGGILAITSAAPSLYSSRIVLCVVCVVLLTVVNLRGVRESGLLFAIPTYGFIAILYAAIGTGVARCAVGSCPHAVAPHPLTAGAGGALTLFVLLKAFASGSAALTGVEAIANGVNAFRRPQSRNAAQTLLILLGVSITLFVGVSWLAVQMHARPSATTSVISQIGKAAFGGSGVPYYLLQGFTFAILLFAANTSFQGFPRLGALLARDRFFPRQFVNLGDRLVYSNGIVVLSGLAIALLVIFKGNVNSLLHLYVVGVFTAFTFSQAGMVRYWSRHKEPKSMVINGIGAAATGVVTLIVIETKFLEGAWAVTIAIPLFVLGFYGVRRHYSRVSRRLRAGAEAVAAAPPATNTVVLEVEELNDAMRRALWYVRQIRSDDVRAVRVPHEGRRDPRGYWWDFGGRGIELETLNSQFGHVEAYLEYVWALPRGDSSFVTYVIPEQFERRSLREALIERRHEFLLKLRLLDETGVAITDVPAVRGEDAVEPERLVCRVLVSGSNAASLRAVHYARTLGIEDTRAVFFAFDGAETDRMRRDWISDTPLEIAEARYRDLGDPLLRYLRGLTAEPGTVVSVVMPELVTHGWRRLLHNQRALYVKRLLLFEPNVILTSVPYQLR
jgi:amino acid transporter